MAHDLQYSRVARTLSCQEKVSDPSQQNSKDAKIQVADTKRFFAFKNLL